MDPRAFFSDFTDRLRLLISASCFQARLACKSCSHNPVKAGLIGEEAEAFPDDDDGDGDDDDEGEEFEEDDGDEDVDWGMLEKAEALR